MIQKVKPFQITRVVTRNIVTDSFQGIRNMFGLRLRGYEKMISQAIEEIQTEAKIKYEVIWWRLSINPLGNKSCMITLYGEAKDE